jgi:hypothetical protein
MDFLFVGGLRSGTFARFGGLLFINETTPNGEDWAWLAGRSKPLVDLPTVSFDQDSRTAFPPTLRYAR